MKETEKMQSYMTELRRGSLTLAVLGSLNKPYYGYALLEYLNGRGIDIEANTLYPLMRRLETQGLLTSDWDTTEARPRKYYSISPDGRELYLSLYNEWKRLGAQINEICEV